MIEPGLWTERFTTELGVQNYSENTIVRYVGELQRFFKFLNQQGLTQLAGLTRQHLHAYRAHLYYARYRGRRLSASTMGHRLNAVVAFVRFLVRHDYLLVDVSAGLEMPRRKRTLPRVILSEEEVLRLLHGPDPDQRIGLRDRTILEVLYGTAIRNAELRQLNLDDLDAAQGMVRILKGKGDKPRWVPMGEEAWIWVEEYLNRCRPQLLTQASEQALFLGRFGNRVRSLDLAVMVQRWGRRVGLEKHVTPHTLRHSCATHMLRRGANLRHLQVMLGHSQVTTTQVYTHVELSDLRKVLQRCHPRECRS